MEFKLFVTPHTEKKFKTFCKQNLRGKKAHAFG